jgi:hypothetical protein
VVYWLSFFSSCQEKTSHNIEHATPNATSFIFMARTKQAARKREPEEEKKNENEEPPRDDTKKRRRTEGDVQYAMDWTQFGQFQNRCAQTMPRCWRNAGRSRERRAGG